MKILQTRFLKNWTLVTVFLTITCAAFAQPVSVSLSKADSLFQAHQYTQSLELYEQLLQQKKYSSAMLLKMAYIQEGLGHMSLSLYYLNLYYLSSDDTQALKKMEEMANRNKLEGYANSESLELFARLREYNSQITGALGAIIFLLVSLMIYQKQKYHHQPVAAAIGLFLFSAVLFLYTNYSKGPLLGIVIESPAYLMSGPSAGSSTVSILSEGHQLQILGKKDVWVNVRWMEQDVFIKENAILPIEL